jgi:hypothetical protein
VPQKAEPRTDADRLYVSRKEQGCEVILKDAFEIKIADKMPYLEAESNGTLE